MGFDQTSAARALDALNHFIGQHLPGQGTQRLAFALDARIELAATVLMAGVALLAIWRLMRPAKRTAGRLAGLALLVALVALPALALVNDHEGNSPLLIGPAEWWFLSQVAPAMLTTPEMAQRVAATAALALASLTALIVMTRARVMPVQILGLMLVGALVVWPLRQLGQRHVALDKLAQAYVQGQALFDSQCRRAGAKRRAVVHDVAGVRLSGLRTEADAQRFMDPLWPDAGIAHDRVGQAYIASFLDFDYWDEDPHPGWGIATSTSRVTFKGYHFVDVTQPDGSVLRLSLGRPGQPPLTERIDATQASPYVVAYMPLALPAAQTSASPPWVAAGRLTVTDTRSGELLGELRTASFAPPTRRHPETLRQRNWEMAETCPGRRPYDVPGAMVRMFTGEVLEPAR